MDLYDSDEEDDQSVHMLDEELGGVTTLGSEPLKPLTLQRSKSSSSKLQGDNSGMRLNRLSKEWEGRSNGRSSSPERRSSTLDESLHCEESAAMGALEAGGLRDEHKLKLQTELLPAVFSAWLAPVVSV